MLAYERVGSGEPLVLLHGIGHRRQTWYPVLDELARHREVILVDLPGHGESPRLRTHGRPAAEAMRDELMAFFAEQGLDRPHIAGNSLGGWIGLDIAELGGARSVTGLSPGGFWYSPLDFAYSCGLFGLVMGIATVLSPAARWLTRSKAGRWLLFSWICTRPANLTPEQALGDFRAFMKARPTVLRFITAGKPFGHDVSVRVPVTVAWADWDLVLPRYQARRARRVLTQGEHLRLPRCGHVPMSDDPALITRIVLHGSRPVEAPIAPAA
ncbi:MAG: alpha/beta fold hydrolase [Streptosporangiaceae bacterium]